MSQPDPRHRRFTEDLERLGYEVVEYNGRFGYQGPAVKVSASEFQGVLAGTQVRVMWDTLGKDGYVVYPESRERLLKYREAMDFSEALKKFGVQDIHP